MNRLRVLFMGTPEFAVGILKELLTSQVNVVGVVTAPDKPSGRGKKLNSSAVKEYASSESIEVLQPTNLKDEEFISELSDLQADLFVVGAFRMLPKMVWAMPELGTFNLHGSLLPKSRGAAPIHWAIINGDEKTGLTTFLLDEKIDTGNIVLQREQEILPNMTTGELHDALLPLGADMVLETANTIAEGSFTALPQEERLVSHAPKLNKENSRLDFSKSPKELVAQIHGLNPFPGAYFGDIKFFRAALTEEQNPSETPKLDVRNKLLMLDYKKGSVQILELKPSGKRLMSATDFINGMKTNQIEL